MTKVRRDLEIDSTQLFQKSSVSERNLVDAVFKTCCERMLEKVS